MKAFLELSPFDGVAVSLSECSLQHRHLGFVSRQTNNLAVRIHSVRTLQLIRSPQGSRFYSLPSLNREFEYVI